MDAAVAGFFVAAADESILAWTVQPRPTLVELNNGEDGDVNKDLPCAVEDVMDEE